jgi:glyoxylate/hydroxypyruvate reductase A
MKLLLLAPALTFLTEWHLAFQETMPWVELFSEGMVPFQDIDAALVYDPPPNRLCSYPNLRAILTLSAGVDTVLADPTLPDVPVIRLANTEMKSLMTEYVAYHVLRLHRRFADLEQFQREGSWMSMPASPPASCRRVSVLGLGRLGLPCTLALRSLGFQVAGWSSRPNCISGVRCFFGETGLVELTKQTDILVCLLPLTEKTKGLLSRELFFRMPRGASIINVSRGDCLNEQDLLVALDCGQISHATLDVFRTEPLPVFHPFWTHPRITVTPHAAADPRPHTCVSEIAQTLQMLRDGETLLNVVDKVRGY